MPFTVCRNMAASSLIPVMPIVHQPVMLGDALNTTVSERDDWGQCSPIVGQATVRVFKMEVDGVISTYELSVPTDATVGDVKGLIAAELGVGEEKVSFRYLFALYTRKCVPRHLRKYYTVPCVFGDHESFFLTDRSSEEIDLYHSRNLALFGEGYLDANRLVIDF